MDKLRREVASPERGSKKQVREVVYGAIGAWEFPESRGGPATYIVKHRSLVQASGSLTAGGSGKVPTWPPYPMQHPMRSARRFLRLLTLSLVRLLTRAESKVWYWAGRLARTVRKSM